MTEDVEKFKQFVKTNGNNYHTEVNRKLIQCGWTTQISPYYLDGFTNKPREIDLIVEKQINHTGEFITSSHQRYPTVNYGIGIKLFVECKFVPQSQGQVFWFARGDQEKAVNHYLKTVNLKEGAITEEQKAALSTKQVAKLFAGYSIGNNGGYSWGGEERGFYKALSQCLNAIVYLRGRPSIIPDTLRNGSPLLTEYPVIICSSFNNFYRVDIENPDNLTEITDHFQLEVDYAYMDTKGRDKNEYFVIDVVDFQNIHTFFKRLERDTRALLCGNHSGYVLNKEMYQLIP